MAVGFKGGYVKSEKLFIGTLKGIINHLTENLDLYASPPVSLSIEAVVNHAKKYNGGFLAVPTSATGLHYFKIVLSSKVN